MLPTGEVKVIRAWPLGLTTPSIRLNAWVVWPPPESTILATDRPLKRPLWAMPIDHSVWSETGAGVCGLSASSL